MSGLLDDLRARVPDASYALDELTGTQAYEWALNDVRDLLRSEETVEACARVVRDERMRLGEVTLGEWEEILHDTRTALAVLAGDDQ